MNKSCSDPISVDAGKITVHRLRDTAAWIQSRPVLIASASARPVLVRQFFPSLEVHASPAPALPHQTVRQYLGAFGKNALRKKKKLVELVTQVRIEAELFGRKRLVITHLEHERAFACVPNTRTLHFGDVAGDDDFGDVDFVFSTGGPLFAQPMISPNRLRPRLDG